MECLQADGEDLYWQERRPDGRTALVSLRGEVAPSVRSRVYEYGGRAFAARDGQLALEEDGPTGDHFISADGAVLFVRERDGATEIARARPNPSRLTTIGSLGGFEVVASGRDFYAAPRVGPGGELAYLAWDLPDMPWDAAELWVDGEHVAGGDGVSCLQPGWRRDGSLMWIDDRSGWWNLRGHPMEAEVGYPAWNLGFQNWCELHDGRLAYTARSNGFERLYLDGRPLDLPFTEYQWLNPFKDGLACIAGGPSDPPSVIAIEPGGGHEVLRASLAVELDEITVPEHISFGDAHALLYAPEGFHALIVLSHGGPTACAMSDLDLDIQFWTSRGYAVADVNYRGSTGYGRAFRESLDGRWGVTDVEDCVACVRHVGADRAIIRGGSAGGYTTLQALTTTDAFAAGSSHYGVGDLVALEEETHRFESRYLGRLVGDALAARSPVNHLEGLNAPVILFQGLDDKVVPPDQARQMAAALEAKGIDHELHLFEGEGHGFRRAQTREAVLEAEAAFFARAVGSPAS